ncbi:hypothetical protein [Nocardia farcinica]|uniref:hypothetical protein n=1 Tax=Nocardia farcinica TaxID=37329 RepID=UPI0022B9E765|nr:hypothetical protein [Nocardia farcinica]MCZ9327260.1 hypothetical protein [Nocardia farcinica]
MNDGIPRIGDVVDYLRTSGWTITGRWRDGQVWSREEFDVLVPPADTLSDTPTRLRELARCVADAEGRSRAAVWRDLLGVGRDSFSYRALAREEAVPLTAGLRAVNAVHLLVAQSARDVLGNGGRRDAVRSLLERSSVAPGVDAPGLDITLPLTNGGPDPLGRRAVQHLSRGAAALLAAVSGGDATPPVSHTLGLALADLAGVRPAAPFSLSFRWSRRTPLPDGTIEFPADAGERLRAAALRARRDDRARHGVVEGRVIRLGYDGGDGRRVTVRGSLVVDDVPTGHRVVTVRLADAADYHTALAAHRDERRVRVEGTVAGTGRARVLTARSGALRLLDHSPIPPRQNGI